eukprot:m.257251 g.257251  ORF g.257251 m.257251 type:complete len:272 (+) comp35094_c0_seq1:1617-2432(+)
MPPNKMASTVVLNKPRLILVIVALVLTVGILSSTGILTSGGTEPAEIVDLEDELDIVNEHVTTSHEKPNKNVNRGGVAKEEPKKILAAPELINGIPAKFNVRFTTTKGELLFFADMTWAPEGVTRLYKLVKAGFFTDNGDGGVGIFRNVKNFVSQFGIHGTPTVQQEWASKPIKDDPVVMSNSRGYLTFAAAGKNTRTTQLYFNLGDNKFLDKMSFAPIAKCTEGCEILDQFEMKYKEKPNQGSIQQQGNAYLKSNFPDLDYITKAVVELA